jgi:hypothetical protein
MTKVAFQKLIRKWHRRLGVFFGIQFFFWTLGGIYFSWTNIKHIKGEDIKKEPSPLQINSAFIHPAEAIRVIQANDTTKHIEQFQLITISDGVYYQVQYYAGGRRKTSLVNAVTGLLKTPLSEKEAINVALNSIKVKAAVKYTEYITTVNGHHEYRNKPLPAYAVTLQGGVNTTVYVSTEMGTVQSYRNNQWRIYDFLWMLHTMDFTGRSDFNNWVLRIFSLAGLLAILSGFAVYITSRRKRKIK